MSTLEQRVAIPYHRSEKGRAKRREYYERTKDRQRELKKAHRHMRKKADPAKVRARQLVGNAVRAGYLPRPDAIDRNWRNRWEFHHPDYTRPYCGVWLTFQDHRAMECGERECPPCTDWTETVAAAVRRDWGLS
jgi:hypothetical protein